MTLKQRFSQIVDKVLIENLPAKVLCLTLALALYFFYQEITLEKVTYTVAVTVKADGVMLPAGPWDPFVKVTLNGKKGDIAGVSDADFSAVLDITYFSKEGLQKVPVRVELPPYLSHLETLGVKVIPDEVAMNMEERLSAQKPLAAQLQGEAASGFDVSRVTLMPTTIQVSGPRSIVGALETVDTEPIPLDGRAASFTAQVGIIPPPKIITLDAVSEDTQVTAAVILVERSGTGRFSVPITAVGIASWLRLAGAPPALNVELTGAQNALGRIRASDLKATIDLAAISAAGSYTLPVVFAAPQGLTVASRSMNSVTVNVEEGGQE